MNESIREYITELEKELVIKEERDKGLESVILDIENIITKLETGESRIYEARRYLGPTLKLLRKMRFQQN
jgi:hypothetical protein